MYRFYDATRITSRRRTAEGMLIARATITRAGTVAYLASELGMAGNGRVRVERTLDSLKHPETAQSAAAAAITVRHPPANQVNPANYRSESVGHVFGTPQVTAGGELVVDILVGDAGAIEFLETEGDEVSIGYAADMEPVSKGLYRTKGPLKINHVAIVPKGRAGSTVRVHDADPWGGGAKPIAFSVDAGGGLTPAVYDPDNRAQPSPGSGTRGAKTMDLSEINALADAIGTKLSAAIAAALPAQAATQATDALDTARVTAIVTDALKPALEPIQAAVTKVQTAQDEAEQKRLKDEAVAKANADLKEFEARVRAEERQRAKVMGDATVLLGDEAVAKLGEADVKALCVAALGDSVPDAAQQDPQFLMGALAMRAADARRAAAANPGALRTLPQGIVPAPAVTDAESDVAKARKEAMDSQRALFDNPIGMVGPAAEGGGMTASVTPLKKTA